MSVKGVTFVIIRPSDEILMQLRDNNSKRFSNMWCFPGGTPEPGESFVETAVREIKEEYNLEIGSEDCKEIIEYELPYEKVDPVSAKVFLCRIRDDQQPILREGADMKWMKIDEIKKLKLGFFQEEIIPVLEKVLKNN